MKKDKSVKFKIIGTIHTPHTTIENIPIQPVGGKEYRGVIEILPELTDALQDLDGFSHIILLFHFHKTKGYKLKVKPFMDDAEHGLFATRTPKRPSPIGLSTVKILKIEGNKIYFEGADMLDGTPLIDLKPFYTKFDNRPDAICGWLDKKDEKVVRNMRSDDRFK